MDKKLIVSALIANALGIFTEDERESLMAMEEEPLENALTRLNALAAKDAPPEPEVVAETPPAGTPTTEEYIASAPPEIRDVLANSLAVHNAQKAELIKTITANAACTFHKDFLATKALPELQGLAALASAAKPAPVANGFYGVPMFNGQATLNAAAPALVDNAGGGLSLPVMTFEPAEA